MTNQPPLVLLASLVLLVVGALLVGLRPLPTPRTRYARCCWQMVVAVGYGLALYALLVATVWAQRVIHPWLGW